MKNPKSSIIVPCKELKPQMIYFTKAWKSLFRHGNNVHTTLDIKVRILLWYNGDLYEYTSDDDVRSSVLENVSRLFT